MKVGAKRMKLVWRVIAVDGEGHGHGNCGHNHRTASAAFACKWAPPGWDDMLVCDLLVRQVRRPAHRLAARARKEECLMGWADCGTDSKGRPIGYAHDATCDEPGCNEPIDRGLAYACGGMHGDDPNGSCEGYFCQKHLVFAELPDGEAAFICASCDHALDHPEADEDDC